MTYFDKPSIMNEDWNNPINNMRTNQTDLNDSNYGGRIVISIYFILVSIFGFIGNMIILIVLFKIPKMRTHTNIFIGSLAVSDISICLMMPFLSAGILSLTGWPLPNWICIVTAILRFVSQASSVWNLVIIAINRLVLVTMSTRLYRKLYQPWTIAINIAFVWLFPFATVIIPYITGAVDIGFDSGPNICSDTDLDRYGKPTKTFLLIQGLVLSCFPLCLVFISYLRIYIFVRSHIRRQEKTNPSPMSAPKTMKRLTPPEPSSSTSDQKGRCGTNSRPKKQKTRCLPTRMKSITSRRNNRLESRITKNCFYVFLGFLLCIIPFGICILGNIGFEGAPLAFVFLVFNVCLNPIIYGTKHPHFKVAMWNVLTAKFSRDSNVPDASVTRRNENNPLNSRSAADTNRINNSQDLIESQL